MSWTCKILSTSGDGALLTVCPPSFVLKCCVCLWSGSMSVWWRRRATLWTKPPPLYSHLREVLQEFPFIFSGGWLDKENMHLLSADKHSAQNIHWRALKMKLFPSWIHNGPAEHTFPFFCTACFLLLFFFFPSLSVIVPRLWVIAVTQTPQPVQNINKLIIPSRWGSLESWWEEKNMEDRWSGWQMWALMMFAEEITKGTGMLMCTDLWPSCFLNGILLVSS